MKRLALSLSVAAMVAALGACGCASAPTRDGEAIRMVLPVGSPELGFLAFDRLRCGSCHTIVGYPELTEERKLAAAPVLEPGNPSFSKGDWATAIVAPGHEASWRPPGVKGRSEGSEMPEYFDWMTVGDLMDLVAFLETYRGDEERRSG